MTDRTVKERLETLGLRQAYAYLDKDPQNNIPKLVDWLEKYDKSGMLKNQIRGVRMALADPNNNWNQLVKSLWTDIDPAVRKRIFENFVVNGSIIGGHRQQAYRERENCNIPWAILMDPTSACNLHCTGCWAAEYGDKLNLSLAQLDDIIRQGKEIGVYFYIYSGGEPLVRKADIINLCEAHPDCVFLSFTNGTLIDEAFADEMLRVQNFIPAISVEGFEAETDSRRGKGTYARLLKGMEILRKKKLPFGVSCCYTSRNTETIGSEAYFDQVVAWGAKFMWLFTYMPVGAGAPTDLMASAKQRSFMYRQVRTFRSTKPLFTMDFWNDGEFVDGCIAGGRSYLHINANGDIEPCAFIHYSDSNIKDKSLLDALHGPLFMAYHENQPFNSNHLRPCPLLDNTGKLADMVDKTGAHSTDLMSPENVQGLCGKCAHAAECWAPVADELWKEHHPISALRVEEKG